MHLFRVQTILRSAAALSLAVGAGCAPEQDPAATNEVLAPGDEGASIILTAPERAEAIAAMQSVVHGPIEEPAPATHGVRWSDVPEAVRLACFETDMAVVRRRTEDNGNRIVFELVTTRDEPGTLIVDRLPPPEMVKASARVGMFAERADDAANLVREFERYLRLFGEKPGFDDPA
ncbi:MAG: hypothetical protein JNM94_11115 [Phycisphaerae bacterium]|nr:hypothetical protein [Phycisphaerae bacterium]